VVALIAENVGHVKSKRTVCAGHQRFNTVRCNGSAPALLPQISRLSAAAERRDVYCPLPAGQNCVRALRGVECVEQAHVVGVIVSREQASVDTKRRGELLMPKAALQVLRFDARRDGKRALRVPQ
jgi:hypothetical protein